MFTQPLDQFFHIELTSSMMAQTSQTGSPELSYNTAVLPPPWQRGNTSLFANDQHMKKRKLETIKTNVTKSQTKPPASQVTTYNRFSILETTEDSMNTTEMVNNLHTQRIGHSHSVDTQKIVFPPHKTQTTSPDSKILSRSKLSKLTTCCHYSHSSWTN